MQCCCTISWVSLSILAQLHRISLSANEIYNFLQFSQDFSLEKYRAFLFRKLRRAWPGLSGSFCACAFQFFFCSNIMIVTGRSLRFIQSNYNSVSRGQSAIIQEFQVIIRAQSGGMRAASYQTQEPCNIWKVALYDIIYDFT